MTFGHDFLREPDLFPMRAGGEAWGGASLRIDVAAGPYRFTGLSSAQAGFLADRFSAIRLADAPAKGDVEIRVFRVARSELIEIREPSWELRMDLDPGENALRFASRGFFGRLDWRPGLAAALWLPETDQENWIGAFENALRIAVAYRLGERGGLLVHSAGILAGDRALVFFGASGAGKSTLSALAADRGLTVLSDELNAIELREGVAFVERMPFSGDFGRQAGPRAAWPLAGLYALRQGPRAGIEPLPAALAAGELTRCAPFVNADPHRSEALLDAVERLVRSVPVRALRFAIDPGVWDILLARP